MIVECPKCSTRFRLNAERLQRVHPTLKCSRCGYVFPLPRSKKQPTPRPSRPRDEEPNAKQLVLGGDDWSLGDLGGKGVRQDAGDTAGDVSESFVPGSVDEAPPREPVTPPPSDWGVFADSSEAAGDPEGLDDAEAKFAEQELTVESEAPKAQRGRRGKRPAQPSGEADAGSFDPPPAVSAEDEEVPDFAAIPEPEEDRPARPRRAKAATRPPARVAVGVGGWLSFAALVAVGYLAVTSIFLTRPAIATWVLGSLAPFADLSETVGLARTIGLSDVRATYQRVEEDRRELDRDARRRKSAAFVVSGTATSGARQAVRDIRVRATLLGADDTVLAQKEVYCGVAVSPEVLAATDTHGITLLERIQPPARFAVSPGESADFVIAFVDPPDGVVRHSVEVVAASPAQR